MNFGSIKTGVTRMIGSSRFWVKKNAPEILLAGGIIMVGVSIATAINSTLKVDKITKPAKEKLDSLKNDLNDTEKVENNLIDVKETKKEIKKTYIVTGLKLTKHYLPTIITFTLSVTSLLSSHKILKGRNLALAAAYATIERGYSAYRQRVKDRFGEEVEKEIYQNITKEKIKVVDENGKEKEVEVNVPHSNKNSDWSVCFQEDNPNWEKSGIINLDFLQAQETFANQKLQAKGYLFLYEVYDLLGLDSTQLGYDKMQGAHVVGWLYDPKDPTRDSYVSFGLWDRDGNRSEQAMNMLRYGERNIWLDFNVDGDILTGDHNRRTFMDVAKS